MLAVVRFSSILLFLIIFAELLVRYTITSAATSISDSEIGWIYKPHSTIFHTKEGWASNTTNSLGFNDDEIINTKTHEAILFLGDSFTEALQVDRTNNFTSLIEKQRPCINSMNASRSGLSPIQYPVILNRFLDKTEISKTIMVLSFGDMNDINKDKSIIIRDSAHSPITKIILKKKKLGWVRKKTDIILSHSALATFFKNRIKAVLANKNIRNNNIELDKPFKPLKNRDHIREVLVYVFNEINDRIPLSIVYIPMLKYLPDGQTEQTNQSILFAKLIKDVASKNKIPFLSGLEFMVNSYQTNKNPPVGFANYRILKGHLNKSGHQSIARTILKLVNIQCSVTEYQTTGTTNL